MTVESNKRDARFDILKAIAIGLVVLGHVITAEGLGVAYYLRQHSFLRYIFC